MSAHDHRARRHSGRRQRGRRGQTTVEFALGLIVFLGLMLGVIDLAHAGLVQHQIDSGVGDLAHSLATISGTNSTGDPSGYASTPLNTASMSTTVYMGQVMPISTAIQQAVTHAAAQSGGLLKASALTMTSPMTLTNGQVTVAATPDLTNTAQLTVTVTTVFTPVVGIFLNHSVLRLSASEADIPFARAQQ